MSRQPRLAQDHIGRPPQSGASGPVTATISSSARNVLAAGTVNIAPSSIVTRFTPQVRSLGNGVTGFKTSFDTSAKGGGAFRAISENFSANPANGTMSLAIPITISPGRGGFQPELALLYDSGGGNGPFGFGWGIALPSVYRKTNLSVPRYQDYEGGEEDDFAVSGADIVRHLDEKEAVVSRLQSTSVGEFEVVVYRPRFDTGALSIEKWVNNANRSDVHWRTITANNQTSIFGDSDSSRIMDTSLGTKRIFSWLLSRSYDAFGNAIDYTYKVEDGSGITTSDKTSLPEWEQNRTHESRCHQKYIKRIKYGNRIPCRDLRTWSADTKWPTDWMFEVVFDYGDHIMTPSPSTVESTSWPVRQDPFSESHAGFEIRNYRTCRRILMFHHFAEQLSVAENLVSSTMLSYAESLQRTVLTSITVNGHTIKDIDSSTARVTGYRSKSMPPWTFQYSSVPVVSDILPTAAKTYKLLQLPNSQTKVSEWLDLNGEGMPGLLTKFGDGSMLYQRNTGPPSDSDAASQFTQPSVLQQHPNLIRGDFEDLDKNGSLNLVIRDEDSRPRGFYERGDGDTWSTYSDFPEIPSGLEWQRVFDIDLIGDGLPDIVFDCGDGKGTLLWQENLGKRGFSKSREIRFLSAGTPELRPRLVQTDDVRTFVADMTGSGMSDLVEITRLSLRYWPNLGHGLFGTPVNMGDYPVLATRQDCFDFDRLRLLDADGSGPTDLLYLHPERGAVLYYNMAGNSWSEGITIPAVPLMVAPSAFFALDLLGRGTSCLCWSDPSGSDINSNRIMYVDLMGPNKPHILKNYTNGLGATTSITYEPSTRYCVEDEKDGLPWTTKLPFPVQCVSTVTIDDKVTGNQEFTSYKYHNGCYDPIEKQFAGFEMVEITESERIVISHVETYEPPPTLTKTWFSVGLGLGVDDKRYRTKSNILSVFHGDPDLAADCFRAMRGMSLRSELYTASDPSSSAANQALQILETSYQLRAHQGKGMNRWSVVQLNPLETLTTQYDRNMTDPRMTHNINLKVNIYGDPEESVRFIYPRETLSPDLPPDVKVNQAAGNVTHVQIQYTNAVLEDNNFRKPEPWRQQEYEVYKYPFPTSGIISYDQARSMNLEAIPTAEGSPDACWKDLRSESRATYKDSLLETSLGDGELQAFSLLDQTFSLALDADIVTRINQGGADCGISADASNLLSQAGYVITQGSDGWWIPSSRSFFSDVSQDSTKGAELREARRSFYAPAYAQDALGNGSWMTMDRDYLIVESMRDALGNVSSFQNDYERLQPHGIIDANLNLAQVAYDPLGFATADATVGKTTLAASDPGADSLEDLVLEATAEDLEDILKNPDGVTARRLLGHANSRTFHQPKAERLSSISETDFTPSFSVHITRSLPHALSSKTDITVQIIYIDGHGRLFQELSLNDPDDLENMWLMSGLILCDKRGQAVCNYQPFYTQSPQLIPPSGFSGVESSINFYDTLGRPVAALAADSTWTKAVYTPWLTTEHDAGSLILQERPQDDPDMGHWFSRVQSTRYSPTWSAQKKAAGTAQDLMQVQKSSVYANTVVITHIGSCGLPVVQRLQNADAIITERRFAYDTNGNRVRDYDTFGRLIEKGLYDKLGRHLQSAHMDSGEKWSISDVLGGLPASWNSRGYFFTNKYDKLHREIERWVQNSPTEAPKLVIKFTYGENNPHADPMANTKRQIWKVEDQAGVHTNTKFDMRARCLERTFQAVEEYKEVVDWSGTSDNTLLSGVYSRTFTYDSFGQVLEKTDSQGNRTRTHFTRLGHIDKVDVMPASNSGPGKDWKPLVLSASFSADGLPLVTSYGNKSITRCTYDKHTRHLISQLTTREGRVGPSSLSRERIEDITYTYDCAGRRISTVDASEQAKYFRGAYVKPKKDYTYDSTGRLISATGRAQLTATPGSQLKPYDAMTGQKSQRGIVDGGQLYQYVEKYEYDAEGNIPPMIHKPLSETAGISGWTRKYFYEERSLLGRGDASIKGNRLSRTSIGTITEGQYRYDGDAGRVGCMTSLPKFSELDWNMNNMLGFSSTQRVAKEGSTPERTYYIYDHAGNRVRKVTESSANDGGSPRKGRETLFLDDVQMQTKQDGTQLWIICVRGSTGHPLAMIEHSALRKRPLYRLQIGEGMELDEDAKLVSYEEYSPFGSAVYSATYRDVEASRTYRFAKYEHDRETGLYHCGKRYYCPWLGRWTSPDPMGDVDGPNLYEYVRNDPMNFTDAGGTSSEENRKDRKRKGERHDSGPGTNSDSQSDSEPQSSATSVSDSEDENKNAKKAKVIKLRKPRMTAAKKKESTDSALKQMEAQLTKTIRPDSERLANLTALAAATRQSGDQHHIFRDVYAHLFKAGGIDADALTLYVGKSAHLSIGNITDKAWNVFFINMAQEKLNGGQALTKEQIKSLKKEDSELSKQLITYIEQNKSLFMEQAWNQQEENMAKVGATWKDIQGSLARYQAPYGQRGVKITMSTINTWLSNAEAKKTS